VKKVNLEVEEASFVSILGPSGSGKTTLLSLIGLLDYPSSGTVYFKGQNVSHMTKKARRDIRFNNIGFVFQTFNLLPTLTALENVELPLALGSVSLESQKEKALRLINAVGLAKRLQHRSKKLSTGEMQRVAIARALVNDPCLVLADEPTGELDSEKGSEIIELLYDLCKKQKTTVIVTTHDKRVAEVADATYFIRDGSLSVANTS
jgi:ABC-type lipoprotein export system ATPase subunit